ncbi:hypothetical protein N7454_000347 [Penicillium verhagenii]|nr:hypothetical protein N7454_000347 [Penicillium verhagenii]
MSIDSSLGSTEPTPTPASTSGGDTGTKAAQEKMMQPTLSTSIISTICSPFSTLLSATTLYQGSKENASPPNSISKNEQEQEQEQSKAQEQEEKPQPELEPEPYYKPNEVPLFKKLQKKRLSGTRTKQLLRAAGRAYNDPPPPPELGTCCGSSCDPCVNTLWREERDVWRERWGDRKAEGEYADGRKDLEW